ncbi:hypothetical protein [Synechococcus sp. CCY9202]|uniref:hypothetical protein n=1 Tax=Synechococcus sp. CCY9202 TaxID=174698 RepID=UPI002B21620C|nr:hypothetical protein [Synechococcus sp. CCY9202]MEA5424684.1 hypothetical protein [Synechococcus sp. CCY9202]
MSINRYLICDSRLPLHSKAYREAVCLLLESHSIPYSLFDGRHPKRTYLTSALEFASAADINRIVFITMEEINGVHLLWDRIKNYRFRSIDVFCFYFKFSNLQGWSMRSLFISICFAIAPVQKIIISRKTQVSGYSRFLLGKKLHYAPDFFSDLERPSISTQAAKSHLLQLFSLPSNSIVISYVGMISEKKAISTLLFLIQESIQFLLSHNVMIVIAGPLEPSGIDDSQIQLLQSQGVVAYRPELLSNYDFYCVVAASDAVWCVQQNFSNSSGIFTRTCSWGSIPIVALDSYIGSLVLSLDLGYILDIHSKCVVDDFKNVVISLLSQESRMRYLAACKQYSASCGIDSFHDSLKPLFLT